MSDRYKLCHEGGEPWVMRPNNGGEVGPDADEIVDELNELKSRLDALAAVEREWDPNTLAGLLGGAPGESQRAVIQREVPRLLERVKRLEEAGEWMAYARDEDDFTTALKSWIQAKEDPR